MTESGYAQKIVQREALPNLLAAERAAGRRIGYTSGVFDLLHHGHVDYLEHARALCDLLVVGVNSDESVRKNKGPCRPICAEQDRAAVVAALASVDYVFIFPEQNNTANITLLKPDLYIKAGDYDRSKLASAPIVEAYGGQVCFVPLVEGLSSTRIIRSVVEKELGPRFYAGEIPLPEKRPAVFLDRDGTINEEVGYLHEPEKLKIIPGALEGMKKLSDAGYRLIIISNQPGIGLGYYQREDFFSVTRELFKHASRGGVLIDKVYFCPHSKADNCRCRKPGTELVERAQRDCNIDVASSFMVGDMTSDLQLARNAGMGAVLVQTGSKGDDGQYEAHADHVAPDLAHAADWIVAHTPRDAGRSDVAGSRTASTSGEEPEEGDGSLDVPSILAAIGHVTANFGHDLNNLLGAIQGGVDLLERKISAAGAADEKIPRLTAVIRSSLARASEITARMRGYVRPEPFMIEERPVRACLEWARSFLEGAGAEVLIGGTGDATVSISEFFIQQALTAVCMNALEAFPPGSDRVLLLYMDMVEVSPGGDAPVAPGRYVRISIMDHGRGIAADQLSRAMQPFFARGLLGVSSRVGLGLSMASEIMRRHGGGLALTSIEDCGTVAHLYLPIAVPSSAS